jgi:hypothetical protein
VVLVVVHKELYLVGRHIGEHSDFLNMGVVSSKPPLLEHHVKRVRGI